VSGKAALSLVTGASRGIGRATALALASRGQPLVLLGRSSPELEESSELCRQAGAPSVTSIVADLRDPTAIASASAATLSRAGVPDIVIHNAGVVHRGSVERLTEAEWNEQIQVNLSAPFLLTRALLPRMRARKSGRILFVASISSTLGSPDQSAYNASKWGIIGFMKSLAAELSDSGLLAAAVLPGSVSTRMLDGSRFPARMSASDVAQTLVFLGLDAPLAHNGAVVEMFGV
jgi:3-oxoacyl-[acyl-carrier protein] reductase